MVAGRLTIMLTALAFLKKSFFSLLNDMFLGAVRKYTRIKKLTPQILNELIEKIEVYQSKKIDGKTVQKLKIHYNCIGPMKIPKLKQIPDNNVKIHTRQGVDIEYSA